MRELADTSLVIAALKPDDALHARAVEHLRTREPLVAPFSVSLELLLIAKRHGLGHVDALTSMSEWFLLEKEEVLFTAAEALDSREVPTLFDAVHLAEAHVRGGSLHTADEKLQRTSFPTTPF